MADQRDESLDEHRDDPLDREPDDADRRGGDQPELVLHEERVSAYAEPFVHARARIGKRIVTDRVTVEVDVRREELYVEYLPPEDAEPEYEEDGSVVFGDANPREMILYREEPVIGTRVVPVERVLFGRGVLHAVASDEIERQHEDLDIETDGDIELTDS